MMTMRELALKLPAWRKVGPGIEPLTSLLSRWSWLLVALTPIVGSDYVRTRIRCHRGSGVISIVEFVSPLIFTAE